MQSRMSMLVDAHCHLQDRRLAVAGEVGSLIRAASNVGVRAFAVNGTSEMALSFVSWILGGRASELCKVSSVNTRLAYYLEVFFYHNRAGKSHGHGAWCSGIEVYKDCHIEEDWELVKKMSETHPSVIPNFGLHPWFAGKRSSNWLTILKGFFETVPSAAVGEIGLDKGCAQGKAVDFAQQIQVFKQQLDLGKQLQRPISVHCVSAFGDLHEIIEEMGTFPAGIILHSYLGSAEMVPRLTKFGAYFSFSGFITSIKLQKARKIVQAVPMDRILLETDAPDALPHLDLGSLVWVPGDPSVPPELQEQLQHQLTSDIVSNKHASPVHESRREGVDSSLLKKALNHPANIYSVLEYVAYLLEISKEQLAQISYENAVRVFSFPGSKLC